MLGKSKAGFTIIELIITIVILVILTTIVVVRLTSTQVGSRDQKRETDITTLATALENYYQNGDPVAAVPAGYYPGASQVTTAAARTPAFNEFLEGVPLSSYYAPDSEDEAAFGVDLVAAAGVNPDGSYNDSQARNLLENTPYLYQPLQRNNQFCAHYASCVKFNLYYLHEGNDEVVKIRSKNQ